MRTLWPSVLMSVLWVAARAAGTPAAIYDHDPNHLWNRLYRAVAVRTESGVAYGSDNAEPYGEPFDDPTELTHLLDRFLKTHGERLERDPLRRAIFQNDLWAAFDLAASPAVGSEGAAIRKPLASAIARLTLSQAALADLPDNYAQALRSGTFADDFDPENPHRAFLPPDLFDPQGPWVQIRDQRGGLVAPAHIQNVSGRSTFAVFIRCPGGRETTLAYLDSLNLYPTPWEYRPAEIATLYPTHEKIRWDPLRFNPQTPQFPPGTIVALVRRMMAIDEQFQPVPTRITQSIEFRVYQKVGGPGSVPERNEFAGRQFPFELVMRRADLLSGTDGGLRAVAPEETEYRLTTIPAGGPRADLLRGPVVLSMCARCHPGDGIFSVNAYSRRLSPQPSSNPQLPPATDPAQESAATTYWKTQQFDWGLLRGLLEAGGLTH